VYEGARGSEGSVIKLFGRESFFIYVFHLIIVYGSSVKFPSLINSIGPALNYLQCIGVFILVSVAMYIAALSWNNLKRNDYIVSRRVQYLFIAVVVYFFISRPY